MKLSNHSAVAIRAAALVLLLGAASPLAGQTLESPSGKMLTQAGVDSIVDSVGAVWTLGPSDASGIPANYPDGVVDAAAAVHWFSCRSFLDRIHFAGGMWKLSNDSALATRASALVLSPGAIWCVAGQALESPSGKMLTQAGV